MRIELLLARVSKRLLKEVKASGGCHGFGRESLRKRKAESGRQLRRGVID